MFRCTQTRLVAALLLAIAGCGSSNAADPDASGGGGIADAQRAPIFDGMPGAGDASSASDAGAADAALADASTPDAALPIDATVNLCSSGRALAERPDDSDLYQVHVIYMIPSDGTDRALDTDGTLENSVGSFNNWLSTASGGSKLRLDTCNGELDISFFQSSMSDATIASSGVFVRDELEEELNAAGFDEPNKLYAVYYDGVSNTACGGAAYPPLLIGNVGALYLQGLPQGPVTCASNAFASSPTAAPGYLEFAMLHELVHSMGYVPSCAPNHHLTGHASDSPTDLMYSGNEPWQPSVLDINNDDYWQHGQAGCPDLSKSVFLAPLPANAQLPPGWQTPRVAGGASNHAACPALKPNAAFLMH